MEHIEAQYSTWKCIYSHTIQKLYIMYSTTGCIEKHYMPVDVYIHILTIKLPWVRTWKFHSKKWLFTIYFLNACYFIVSHRCMCFFFLTLWFLIKMSKINHPVAVKRQTVWWLQLFCLIKFRPFCTASLHSDLPLSNQHSPSCTFFLFR